MILLQDNDPYNLTVVNVRPGEKQTVPVVPNGRYCIMELPIAMGYNLRIDIMEGIIITVIYCCLAGVCGGAVKLVVLVLSYVYASYVYHIIDHINYMVYDHMRNKIYIIRYTYKIMQLALNQDFFMHHSDGGHTSELAFLILMLAMLVNNLILILIHGHPAKLLLQYMLRSIKRIPLMLVLEWPQANTPTTSPLIPVMIL